MINFRKLKQDLSPQVLKEGQTLHKNSKVLSVKILSLTTEMIRLNCSVAGKFDNEYTSELEIDCKNSQLIDSDCDCPYSYDCAHLAAVLFHLEDHLDKLLVDFSRETAPDEMEELEEEEKEEIRDVIKEAEKKEKTRSKKKHEKELISEYTSAARLLALSPFFVNEERAEPDKAELIIVFNPPKKNQKHSQIELKLALRVPYRSKPLHVPDIKAFLDAVRNQDSLYIGNRRFHFAMSSFSPENAQLIKMIIDSVQYLPDGDERGPGMVMMEAEDFGVLLAHSYDLLMNSSGTLFGVSQEDRELMEIPCFAVGTMEESLKVGRFPAHLNFEMSYLDTGLPKIFLAPSVEVAEGEEVQLEEVVIFDCQKPGLLYNQTYQRFQPRLKRKHLRSLEAFKQLVIPEPLFGTFIENALPELMKLASVKCGDAVERFVTLPFTGELQAVCDIHYLDGEIEAQLSFLYDKIQVPYSHAKLKSGDIQPFVDEEGILARNLTEEEKIAQSLFQGFSLDPKSGSYVVKNDKKIVEFMTEVVPEFSDKVQFNCPKNLLDKFVYDDTKFEMNLKEADSVDGYLVELKVKGHLKGLTVDQLWDCLASKRTFIEFARRKTKGSKTENGQLQKVLVLDLDKLAPVLQIFDEIGLKKLDDYTEERPLWSLASVSEEQFKGLPIKFKMSKKLKAIQHQMLGLVEVKASPVPKEVNAELREYQQSGVSWLERLRKMRLSGILADDMGLGKTIQAITAVTQMKKDNKDGVTLIVCPTSLVYNWREEFQKFSPKLKTLVIDGIPTQRKKLIQGRGKTDILITSYSLIQKDIEHYKDTTFNYVILDEAQHIKNRATRNAKSVKMLKAEHRLILTGTPIENSLDELWSLFDFLMPGLLSSYERFNEKFIRGSAYNGGNTDLELLRKKVSPFILRRMKKDVLKELPPVSNIVYHCHLSDVQKELYQSFASQARKELSALVKKEGFNKVQIQILATLTRLKQICCHPAIFAKDSAEPGDSAKYDMLLELLQNLMEGGHKTVIFSQYTRMLQLMKKDLENKGVKLCYLDGATKNRLEIVKEFNEDPSILVFLVSLKAGGTGLNLVGADSVIHYDPWWNPAAEDQATDRVHRIGQKNNVSSYKLVTLNTIEEKIQELQNRKRGLVKKIISSDEEALGKLTWDEVLELLKT